jgi:hypothetical protein
MLIAFALGKGFCNSCVKWRSAKGYIDFHDGLTGSLD